MKKTPHFFAKLLVSLAISIAVFSAAAKTSSNPTGRWQATYASSGHPSYTMQVTESGGVLTGTIVEVSSKPGRQATTICVYCTGEYKNQPWLGMVILKNASYDSKSKTWVGGTFIRPDTGMIYHAVVSTSNQDRVLQIRATVSGNNNGLMHNYRWQRVG